MSRLQLSFLGTPIIEVDGVSVGLETRKSLALLAYVSLSNQENPREVLATLFWGEFDQKHALSNLRRNLASLNKKLKIQSLVPTRETIAIKSSPDLWIDINEFTTHQEL